jgi:hypothetical protein
MNKIASNGWKNEGGSVKRTRMSPGNNPKFIKEGLSL